MEDGVTEMKELVFSETRSRDDDNGTEEKESIREKTSGGFINNLMSGFSSNDKEDDERNKEGEKEVEGGGLINDLISNLVSPLSPKSNDEEKNKIKDTDTDTDTDKGGGGMFNNLISGILHHSTEDGGGDQGFIDSIVSHLPDDAAPETDEASMLIHSLVHD